MKKSLLFLLISSLFLASCSDDDTINVPALPEVSIENISNANTVAQGDTLYFKAVIDSKLQNTMVWFVDGKQIETTSDSILKFVSEDLGAHVIKLHSSNLDGEASASISVDVYGKYKYGTFVLNEGSAFQENSSLTFINPNGVVTDSAYWKANKTELGNVTQDLFISDGRIYFIAQNGKSSYGNYANDGKLIVANSETLKKEIVFDEELALLSWPTHLAVLGTEVFIRDNKGVYSFNTLSQELSFIEGSVGASKNRMAKVNNKIFVPAKNTVLVLEKGKKEVSHIIEFDGTVSGVIKTDDNNIYVSTTGATNKISKINASDYSLIKGNEITEAKVSAGWGATPGISAKGDTIYYGNASVKIYRHIFSTGVSQYLIEANEFVEDAGMAYNNLAVHPITGEVYQTTIKGYGLDFLINNISVFNFSGSKAKLTTNFKNHTHFPAGIFFTYDF